MQLQLQLWFFAVEFVDDRFANPLCVLDQRKVSHWKSNAQEQQVRPNKDLNFGSLVVSELFDQVFD